MLKFLLDHGLGTSRGNGLKRSDVIFPWSGVRGLYFHVFFEQ